MQSTWSKCIRTFERAVHAATIGGAAAIAIIGMTNPDAFSDLTRKDGSNGAGLVENLTVLVLLPAIAAASYALVRWRKRLPFWWVKYWLLMWVLACIYFAGEECSWGQWYFGWETPAPLANLNDQNEMNLHNISSWLDQKPRAMVETFVAFVGFLLPFIGRLLVGTKPVRGSAVLSWIFAPSLCWSAGAAFLIMRICGFFDEEPFRSIGDSEVLELVVAWFLSLYLLSYAIRMSNLVHDRATLKAASLQQ